MKKALLIMILAAGFQQLKAQQSVKPMPDMKLSDGLNGNLFKPQTIKPLAPYTGLNPDSASIASQDPNAMMVYSKMPVARISRSNIDHMPVYNPAASGMHYDMLIKKVIVNPVEPAVKAAP